MSGLSIKDKLLNNGNGNQINPVANKVDANSYYVHPSLKDDFDGIEAVVKGLKDFGTQMGHRNFLLTGPPGTGKTLGVQYLSTRMKVPLFDGKGVSSPQQITQFYAQLRDIVVKSKDNVFVMLDELDRFSTRDEVIDPNQQQTLNQLLIEMDGTDSNNGIFIFGMSNKPNSIDPALRRPGRFSKEIEFLPPNQEGRLAILKIHAEGKGGHRFHVDNDDLEYISQLTFGYTGGDLRGLLDESFIRAKLRDTTDVSRKDLDFALKRIKPSAIRDMPFREPKKNLSNIGGYSSHKEIIRRILDRSKGNMVLLYGPSGTGKTDIVEAVAGEYKYNFIVVSGSEPEDKFIGETGKKLDKYLERAKQLSPCILLLDELDALVERKGMESWKGSWTGLLQSKLSQPIEGVYIFGTMNRPDLVGDSFIKRFPHRLFFGNPSPEDQENIWRLYLANDVDPKALVSVNSNLVGRDISNASKIINDFGLERTVEVYSSLVKDINHEPDVDYNSMKAEVGDAVTDYDKVKSFVIKGGTKK